MDSAIEKSESIQLLKSRCLLVLAVQTNCHVVNAAVSSQVNSQASSFAREGVQSASTVSATPFLMTRPMLPWSLESWCPPPTACLFCNQPSDGVLPLNGPPLRRGTSRRGLRHPAVVFLVNQQSTQCWYCLLYTSPSPRD